MGWVLGAFRDREGKCQAVLENGLHHGLVIGKTEVVAIGELDGM